MREQYNEEELKRIILGTWEAPDFGAEYDSLTTIPSNRIVEDIDERDIPSTLHRAYTRAEELRQQWIQVSVSPTYSNSIRLIYAIPQTREEYIRSKMNSWRSQSSSASYKHYLFTSLGLRNESSIRNIFVKLLLEHKISTQDFADLVQAKDVEVDLVELCGWDQRNWQNYFI